MSSVQDTQLIQDMIKYSNEDITIDIVDNVCNNYIEEKIRCHKQNKEIRNKITAKKIRINDYTIGSACAICIDQFRTGQLKKTIMCGHEFHKKCIDLWLCCHNTCPTCRFKIE